MASPTVAANAYANLARVLESGGSSKGNANLARIMETGGLTGAADGAGPSFSAVLKDAIGGVLEAGRKSDSKTVAMANGKANVMDVVTAVAETDVAVSTLVSVRDKVIQAYEDIMKMTI
jgi:flagellar hook-basal body complex protein FliE